MISNVSNKLDKLSASPSCQNAEQKVKTKWTCKSERLCCTYTTQPLLGYWNRTHELSMWASHKAMKWYTKKSIRFDSSDRSATIPLHFYLESSTNREQMPTSNCSEKTWMHISHYKSLHYKISAPILTNTPKLPGFNEHGHKNIWRIKSNHPTAADLQV